MIALKVIVMAIIALVGCIVVPTIFALFQIFWKTGIINDRGRFFFLPA